ncbi:hypothetical protein [Maribacter sp. 2-571]|uniref:hypothetical protein n=1 Tax=Maribacter sp. 2-571 TaxID=3417569 RepID=UPI003D331FA8
MKRADLLNLVAYLSAVLILFNACGSDDMDPSGENPQGGFPETDLSGYDADRIPAKSDPLPNLLQDDSFEGNEWFACGGASIATDANAYSGSQTAILENDAICETADAPFFTTRNAILMQTLDIQQLPELLTISFWIRADTALPEGALKLYMTNSQEGFLGSLAGGQGIVSYFDESKIGSEWRQIKLYYENDGDSFFLSNSPPFSLVFQLEVEIGYTEPIRLYIDDVKLSSEDETFTQPEPLPEGLQNYAGSSRILFLNDSNNTISSMEPNGQNVVNHSQIPLEFINSIPQWYGSQEITMAQKTFNPANPGDLEIVPASGTDLFRYNLVTNDEEVVYQTIGDPGRFTFTNDPDNREAIDIEVRRTSWDLPNDRGALTVCGRSRNPGFVSDDVCSINIVDTNDFSVINDELRGFNAVWSSRGQLAYYGSDGIYVADVNGASVNTELVHPQTGIGTLMQEVDWNPAGDQLVFAESAGGVTFLNGALINMFTISTLDVNNGTITPLLNVDHGALITNLSWSPDGEYIVYTLSVSENASQIWWLEVATGKTGPLTNTLNARYAYWSK